MRNIKLSIAYDGTKYSGWQCQKNGIAIQDVIESSLKKITGRKTKLIASGRTDAGVHAAAQVANFKTISKIPLKNLQMALNSSLPKDIVIIGIKEANLKFNSQHDARSKIYCYTIANNDFVDPFIRRFAAKCFFKLNLNEMKRAAKHLIGRHDFRSFQTKDRVERNSVRTIKRVTIVKNKDIVYIYMEADGFLYNMARSIAGTLVEAGRGKIDAESVKNILLKKDRRFCGPTMPAKGLSLLKVKY